MVWFEFLVSRKSFPVGLDCMRNGFVWAASYKKAEHLLESEYKSVIIVREVK
jgi:hypothetical protein